MWIKCAKCQRELTADWKKKPYTFTNSKHIWHTLFASLSIPYNANCCPNFNKFVQNLFQHWLQSNKWRWSIANMQTIWWQVFFSLVFFWVYDYYRWHLFRRFIGVVDPEMDLNHNAKFRKRCICVSNNCGLTGYWIEIIHLYDHHWISKSFKLRCTLDGILHGNDCKKQIKPKTEL